MASLAEEGKLQAPFQVIHVDAHADLGAGWNLTCKYVETELLALSLDKRSSPRFARDNGINSGNYLVAAIANRWIDKLIYVRPTNPVPAPENFRAKFIAAILDDPADQPPAPDLPPWGLSADWSEIRLAHRTLEDFNGRRDAPISVEKCPFELIYDHMFRFSGFTHMVVAQSPQYTPPEADPLLQVIEAYYERG